VKDDDEERGGRGGIIRVFSESPGVYRSASKRSHKRRGTRGKNKKKNKKALSDSLGAFALIFSSLKFKVLMQISKRLDNHTHERASQMNFE
jgi:hypothetical protein